MIVSDPEKRRLAEEYNGELQIPVSKEESPLVALQRDRHRRRYRKALTYTAVVLVLLVSFKALTRLAPISEVFGGSGIARHATHAGHPRQGPPLDAEQREKLFLSIPSTGSALGASRDYATHPHLAGSEEDFADAKVILQLFQDEFNIPTPHRQPIFSAGSKESRQSTLRLTGSHAPRRPTAWIDVYYPILNTPLDHSLEILGPDGGPIWAADLEEDGDPLDEDAHEYRTAVPSWHGLSKDGSAEGQLVYANYGTKEDYEELVATGTNLTGKIVVTRYGGIFRGLKIKGAEERGAAGVIIYSDPRDDGYVTVQNGFAPYPAGPARNPTSVQRGSVQYLSKYPGDPTTPGYPAYENADREEADNTPGIPSLPISWQNAQRLLEEIGEIYVEDGSHHKRLSGSVSESKVKLVNHVDNKVTPIWNTMTAIPGHIRDEVVVMGGHRDAWVMGAADPTSGTVSMHEVIRGFGALLRKGWKPLRTVVIASWDAEEYGLVGSTEWGEDFSSWISDHVVAYLNLDNSVSGSRWGASGSPSLAHIIKQTALEIAHPTIAGKALWDARFDDGPYTGATADAEFIAQWDAQDRAMKASDTGIRPLGSGSDFTVFLQHLGVASLDQGFSPGPSDAVYHYHSIYDSQRWQELYADVGFHRHVAVAQHLGLLALRIIDSIIIPLNTTQYALELDEYLDKVEAIVPKHMPSGSVDFSELRRSIHGLQAASAALDVEKHDAEVAFKELLRKLPHFLHDHNCTMTNPFLRRFSEVVKHIFKAVVPGSHERHQHRHQNTEMKEIGDWHGYLASVLGTQDKIKVDLKAQPVQEHPEESLVDEEADIESDHVPYINPHLRQHHFPIRQFIRAVKRVSRANKKLIKFERGFISEGGIKDREWYKHLGVAPGKWLGYGATTFPALTEALEDDHSIELAELEITRLRDLLDKLTDVIQP